MDFEKETAKDVMNGLEKLADALNSIPAALATCKASESDIKQITSALKQLKHPKTFFFKAFKNLLVNGKDIYKEITTAVSDYRSQTWLDFGVQVGLALHKIIVGDVADTFVVLPAKEVAMIAGGITEGFIGVDDVKVCMQGQVTTLGDLEEAIKDFEKETVKDVKKGLEKLADALDSIPAALATCKASESDIKQITNALKQLKHPKSFFFRAFKNLLVNGKDIYKEITTAVSDYRSQTWSDFGVQVGLALHKIIVGGVADTFVVLPAKEA